MKSLQIKTHKWFQPRIRRKVAENWNELTATQLLRILHILYTPSQPIVQKWKLLKVVLDFTIWQMYLFSNEQIAFLFEYINFIADGNGLHKQIMPRLRVPIVSVSFRPFRLRVGLPLYLYGPADRLKNVTFDELIFADSLFTHYYHTKDVSSLDRFVAVLYRPKQVGGHLAGDVREPFNKHTIESRAKKTARLPLLQKLAVYHFYQGCRTSLTEQYTEVFSGEEKGNPVAQPWLEMARHIPSEKFGTIPQILTQNLHLVLYHLNGTIKDTKEQIDRQKQQNPV